MFFGRRQVHKELEKLPPRLQRMSGVISARIRTDGMASPDLAMLSARLQASEPRYRQDHRVAAANPHEVEIIHHAYPLN